VGQLRVKAEGLNQFYVPPGLPACNQACCWDGGADLLKWTAACTPTKRALQDAWKSRLYAARRLLLLH
jgi:hypothetical protein